MEKKCVLQGLAIVVLDRGFVYRHFQPPFGLARKDATRREIGMASLRAAAIVTPSAPGQSSQCVSKTVWYWAIFSRMASIS